MAVGFSPRRSRGPLGSHCRCHFCGMAGPHPRLPSAHQQEEGIAGGTTGYAIRMRGALDPIWSSWFEGMDVRSDRPGESVITGPVADQAALHGLLKKIRDLGIPIISVHEQYQEEP
jgi:hypothetical protein